MTHFESTYRGSIPTLCLHALIPEGVAPDSVWEGGSFRERGFTVLVRPSLDLAISIFGWRTPIGPHCHGREGNGSMETSLLYTSNLWFM